MDSEAQLKGKRAKNIDEAAINDKPTDKMKIKNITKKYGYYASFGHKFWRQIDNSNDRNTDAAPDGQTDEKETL